MEGASLLVESETIENNLREQFNSSKTKNQWLWKDTEDYEALKLENHDLKQKLEAAEKHLAKLEFQNNCVEQHICCLQEELELHAVTDQPKDSEPAPAATKPTIYPFLTTIAVAAVAYFISHR